MGERGVEYAGERIAAFVRDDDDVHTVVFEQGVDIVGYVSLTYLCRFAAERREVVATICEQGIHALGR